ncbi:MAG: glycosyltransferase family 2 protein [Bacillales bacterium]|jgi:cellulose synthase/poly-beta-1,6-N-acetylglucosamine synthase-like glycosyltransferase|nr:glycosyltransferase family 2 protein [Bacillales bacterium]
MNELLNNIWKFIKGDYSFLRIITSEQEAIGNTFGTVLNIINYVIMVGFGLLYAYQVVLTFIAVFWKPRKYHETEKYAHFAILTCSRNEESVIEQFIETITKQNYPKDKITIIVLVDNCIDKTAEIARQLGVNVIERNDTLNVGKSFALDYAYKQIHTQGLDNNIDGYVVFDTDNLLDKNFLKEINKAYQETGYQVLTGFRNTSNIGGSFWTAGTAYWFFRESFLLHKARAILDITTFISGTGYFISKEIIQEQSGWSYHKFTEDLEFSINYVLKDKKIMFVYEAVFYDEQPLSGKDSWNQRQRWIKGLLQCFKSYGGKLFKKTITPSQKTNHFESYEMLIFATPLPTIVITWLVIFGLLSLGNVLFTNANMIYFIQTFLASILDYFWQFIFATIGLGYIISFFNWREMKCSIALKLLYPLVFWIYILSFLILTFITPYKKITWKPIKHYKQL